MEKKLKKVQRGAAFGFVLLKILRILLIIIAIVLITGLVILAVVNVDKLKLDAVQDGKLILDMQSLDLGQIGMDSVPNIGGLIQDGVLTLDLKDVKLAVLMLLGASILLLAAVYVLLLVAGNLFKHMKAEDTPFTTGNIRRLRLLGALHIVFWACGLVLGYFISSEFVRYLALPSDTVTLSLNLSSLLIALIFFFLARVFSFGKAQGEALQAAICAPSPVPEPRPEPVPEPVYAAPAEPVSQTPVSETVPNPAEESAGSAVPAAEEIPAPVQAEE